MNITNAGIGSGLDLEGIIEAYVTAESLPTEIRLQQKEERLTTELSGVGRFKSTLSNFESILKKVSDADNFNKQLIDVSSEDISVTTNGFASNGNFDIEVLQVANGSRVQSTTYGSSADTVGTGTLTFNAGPDNTFDVAINGTDSLSAIRDKINEQSENFGITANVVTTDAGSFISYTSTVTGLANDLSVSSTGDAALAGIAESATTEVAAQNAIIKVDGNQVTKETNEFKNVIEDVTIVANAANVGSSTTISIAQDKESGKALVDEFVDGYNTMVAVLGSLGNAESGELAFDPNIRSLKSQLTAIVTDSVNGMSGSIQSLNDMGVSLNRSGLLEVNPLGIGSMSSGTEKLDDALTNNLDEVGELFASTDGIASQLSTLIESYNGSDGTLTKRNSALSLEISGIKDEYSALETRLRDYEDTLRRKFTFLDQTVASYSATGDWLTANLSSMLGNNDK